MFYRFECGCEGLFCGEATNRIILRGCGECPQPECGFIAREPFEAPAVDRPLTDLEVSSLAFRINGLISDGIKLQAIKRLLSSI